MMRRSQSFIFGGSEVLMSTTTWCNMSKKLQRIFENLIQHFYCFPELIIYKGNLQNPYQTLYSRIWLGILHVFPKCLNRFFDDQKKLFSKTFFFEQKLFYEELGFKFLLESEQPNMVCSRHLEFCKSIENVSKSRIS